MATAAAGASYTNAWPASPPPQSRSSPTPDTTSPVYPGRPIRPMPKRRIRDRLSAEHAATIDYPPQPASSSPIFGYPYGQSEESAMQSTARRGLRAGSHEGNVSTCEGCGHDHDDLDSEEEEFDDEDQRHPAMQFTPESLQIRRQDGEYYGALPIPTLPGHEGYDSFENMSNKKKRKIPQSGMGGHGHSNSLSADMANISLSQRDGAADRDDLDGDGTTHTAGNSYGYVHNSPSGAAGGLSGPGRGRFGRSGRGSLDRRPLAPVQNEPGIISAAIANAAQNMPTTPTRPSTLPTGQENISMLQQHAASKSPPQKTDFTFTPEGGQGGLRWPGGQPPPGVKAARAPSGSGRRPIPNGVPGYHLPPPPTQGHHVPQATAGAMPYPPPVPDPHYAGPAPPPAAGAQQPPHPAQSTQPQPRPRKPRPLARTFDIAARRRKLQKEYQNYNTPPKRDDIWICEFCEYEAIFGVPPRALIWDYEKKDQAERKRLEERRRLLEKAKMKGRKGGRGKGKKGKGNSAAANAAAGVQNQGAGAGAHGQDYADPHLRGAEGEGEDDEYYDEHDQGDYEYEDEHGHAHDIPGAYPHDHHAPPPPLDPGPARQTGAAYHADYPVQETYASDIRERPGKVSR